MYDLSQPNDKPGICCKCKGSGQYGWGASVNGKMSHSGTCFSCRGTGKQSKKQIGRNRTYNRYKVAEICRGMASGMDAARDAYPDPGELAEDRWNEEYR
jgi:DnaJ-class molecular chaperone